MGIFDSLFANRNSSPVWRNKSGKIECPGDDCLLKKCDDTCPIWLNTKAIQMLQIGQTEKAIEVFMEAIKNAPDFKDLWTNLASCHGMMDNHREAQRAYQMAYSIDNNYAKALRGLVISSMNLGQLDKAEQFCNEYALKGSKADADELLENIKKARNSNDIQTYADFAELIQTAIAYGQKVGHIQSRQFCHIPELFTLSRHVAIQIFNASNKAISDDAKMLSICLSWNLYAGIGAVCYWDKNWTALQNKGIFETLTEEKGFYAMDEHVMDCSGIPYIPDKKCEFQKEIDLLQIELLKKAPLYNDDKNQFMELMQTMFAYGMMYQMNKLGMY